MRRARLRLPAGPAAARRGQALGGVAPKADRGQGQGAALLLAQAAGAAQIAAIGNQAGGRVGFFLKTDDFARDHAAMTASGVRFLEPPRHEPYGTVAVFSDPYGNSWDLIEHSAG